MKKKTGKYIAAAALLFISMGAFSQSNDHSIPAWVSDKGYWVVENNIHQPKQHTVRFYNNSHTLVSTVSISGERMNMKRKKVKMQLKTMLESSVTGWAIQHPAENKDVARKP